MAASEGVTPASRFARTSRTNRIAQSCWRSRPGRYQTAFEAWGQALIASRAPARGARTNGAGCGHERRDLGKASSIRSARLGPLMRPVNVPCRTMRRPRLRVGPRPVHAALVLRFEGRRSQGKRPHPRSGRRPHRRGGDHWAVGTQSQFVPVARAVVETDAANIQRSRQRRLPDDRFPRLCRRGPASRKQ
jgi:hypothetical protein